jgi:hypothetical protein
VLLGILARGLVVKLLRMAAAAMVSGLLARLLIDPCTTDDTWISAFSWSLLVGSPLIALALALPRPAPLRYIDNSVAVLVGVGLGAYWSHAVVEVACYEVPLNFLNAMTACAIGLGVGFIALLAWQRLRRTS